MGRRSVLALSAPAFGALCGPRRSRPARAGSQRGSHCLPHQQMPQMLSIGIAAFIEPTHHDSSDERDPVEKVSSSWRAERSYRTHVRDVRLTFREHRQRIRRGLGDTGLARSGTAQHRHNGLATMRYRCPIFNHRPPPPPTPSVTPHHPTTEFADLRSTWEPDSNRELPEPVLPDRL